MNAPTVCVCGSVSVCVWRCAEFREGQVFYQHAVQGVVHPALHAGKGKIMKKPVSGKMWSFCTHTFTAESTTVPEYTYVLVFLLIPNFSLLLQLVFFILIVPSLLLFSASSHLSPPISKSFHVISVSTTLLPAAMELLYHRSCAADLAPDHNYAPALSAHKHTSPLSYIWEIKNIQDELELYIESNMWIIYAGILVYSHPTAKREHIGLCKHRYRHISHMHTWWLPYRHTPNITGSVMKEVH